MGEDIKPTPISGDIQRRDRVRRDRFDIKKNLYQACNAAGFPLRLVPDVQRERGGINGGLLSVWISETNKKKVDRIFALAPLHTAYHLASAVDRGDFSEIEFILTSGWGQYAKAQKIQHIDIPQRKVLDECYKRAYERSNPDLIYRNRLGYLLNVEDSFGQPLFPYDHRYVSLDLAHTHSVTPRRLRQMLLRDIRRITLLHPELAPDYSPRS